MEVRRPMERRKIQEPQAPKTKPKEERSRTAPLGFAQSKSAANLRVCHSPMHCSTKWTQLAPLRHLINLIRSLIVAVAQQFYQIEERNAPVLRMVRVEVSYDTCVGAKIKPLTLTKGAF
jgi:hypothetical protein